MGNEIKSKDKELVEVKIKFDNGEEKILKKAMVVVFEEVEQHEEDLVDTTFHLLNMAGGDLKMAIMAMAELGIRLGMFEE